MSGFIAGCIAFMLCAVCFSAGCYLGWYLRDKMGVVKGEEPLPIVEIPLKDPVYMDVDGSFAGEADPELTEKLWTAYNSHLDSIGAPRG